MKTEKKKSTKNQHSALPANTILEISLYCFSYVPLSFRDTAINDDVATQRCPHPYNYHPAQCPIPVQPSALPPLSSY